MSQELTSITIRFLLRHHSGRYLLVRGAGGEWRLPEVAMPRPPSDAWWREAGHITGAMRRQLGMSAVVLRALRVTSDDAGWGTGLFWMELQESEQTDASRERWVSINDLQDLLGDAAPPAPNENAPWTRPDWFREASEWMRGRLAECGFQVTGEVEQVRSWFCSCILRVGTDKGSYYLKAVPSLFKHEPPLILDLAEHVPGFGPHIVAADVERGRTLMRGVPGVKLAQHPDRALYLPRWEGLLRRFAEIQRHYVGRVDDLLGMGCFDFRLPRLYQDVDRLFAELPQLFGESKGLSTQEIETLQASLPRLRAIFDTLESSGIPPTLHHGDFHSGNILCDTECVVLDWSGFIGVSHPFLFLSVVSEEHIQEEVLSRMIDVYVSAWSDFGSHEELRKLARLGIVVGWLAGAVGHTRQMRIRDGAWDEEQDKGSLVYCLRALLSLLD